MNPLRLNETVPEMEKRTETHRIHPEPSHSSYLSPSRPRTEVDAGRNYGCGPSAADVRRTGPFHEAFSNSPNCEYTGESA